ncbi:PREDICTED: facilitated trehalose transporter Tret1-2 homolog [Dinoponera quadriceps]|uniref:Facilitated trehalose transporter Tret1-2 homolog n=1 Tax=Dinoponera quadriceps TaxID=609295 RepID=A0A6P3Y1H0_DINQU|nr:PREDICTED: facilitated trehalose transporter Tret1-2 homolog [Dinoponera quadriceps]XP_014484650.1 PREDICTED: facilitated trehalose transporter Tret1-2 homolog [Dinoponera quadriceps]XP_014484651.1 PREDICTED: facilitated trehalose transporter Tret1-2 homolog [Dinoponera quadriceps]XP_014484652.1 PREDICTED: facilitated trehalose transporter Tret1-2 homolog [Dinoponera quadriceps]XP_014484653.1 PREDICTED: facilitated trehalose transporter Tret1-2 homolog [Dinoponera quadriceps]XP_014484654.1 
MALIVSEEGQAMLRQEAVNLYQKALSVKSVCEDIENNNSLDDVKSEEVALRKKGETPAHYSSNWKGVLAQCLVTGAVLLLATGGGMPIGYSAVLLPQLSEPNSIVQVNQNLGSWIASVHSLATPFGSLLSGPLTETIGRRGTLQLSAIPLCIGWLIIGFSRSVISILVGRVICGLSVGLMAVPAQVLLGETADTGLRGFLVCGGFAAYCLGILLVYILGATLNWKLVAFYGVVLPVLSFIAFCLLPESPVWLIKKKKIEKARKAFLWLRGGDLEQANAEVVMMEARVKADLVEKQRQVEKISLRQRVSSVMSVIRDPGVLKPLIIINVFNLLQLCSGTYVIVFYAVNLVQDIGGDSINNYLAAVVTAVVRFVFSIVSCLMFLRIRRRVVSIASALGTAVSSLILAGYMLARQEGSSVDSYMLAVFLLIYVAINTIGLLTLPALMIGELIPMRARGVGGGCTFCIFNILIFLITKFFPSVNNVIGVTGIFTIFGVFGLLAAVFLYLALPETKSSTLEEIEDYFKQSNLLWVTRTKVKKRNTITMNNI